ncbi:MAG: sulfotransferase domain-containing protein [Verrucomicrobiota bacterium]|nr:sulfotransferase domain-containing protein [Verrucomicrobiota bacterium]
MSKIDFIGIGAPKCGTTWLSAQLEAHPQIGFAPDKEVYYFADTIMRRLAHSELNCFARGEAWYHGQFPPPGGGIISRGEFCPSYLYLDEAADRIKAYRLDIKLLLCLRPPVEMIYSWYWYGRNAVIAAMPQTFEGMMEDPFLRDVGCFARHLRPYLARFPAENFLVVQFDAIRRVPNEVRRGVYEFLNVDPTFEPQIQKGQNAARAPRFPLLQSSAQKIYSRVSALPGVGKILKSPAVAKSLESVYHRFNSKAQKYAPLTAEEQHKWEDYYAADQAELSGLLQSLRVVD